MFHGPGLGEIILSSWLSDLNRTTHPEFHPSGVRTYNLLIMHRTLDTPEMV